MNNSGGTQSITPIQNGVIAFEMDRIEQAQRLLKDLERRCQASAGASASSAATPDAVAPTTPSTPSAGGWFSSMRARLFGAAATTPQSSTPTPPHAHYAFGAASAEQMRQIEEQIILADAFLSSAILTFLTQDITG